MTTNLGIKNVTYENWLSPDPLMHQLMMSEEEWAASILEPRLDEKYVPSRICKLFEVARSSMLYGYFFYPLFTLAYEQLLRFAEAAISEKCELINAKKINSKFKGKLDYLGKIGILSDDEYHRWNSFRELRNIASHPEQQTILPPGITLRFIFDTSELINTLFAPEIIK
jgi:hypothetical protein